MYKCNGSKIVTGRSFSDSTACASLENAFKYLSVMFSVRTVAHCLISTVRLNRRAIAFCTLTLSVPGLCIAQTPGQHKPFNSVMAVYQDNRANGIGNFVTPDMALLAYSLIREKHIIRLERESIIPGFVRFLELLDTELESIYETGTTPENRLAEQVHTANRQFLSLLLALAKETPARVPDDIRVEYSRVLAADGIYFSEYWGRQIDYSQFQLRGRYKADPTLRGYFRAYRYASSMLFAVQASASTGLTNTMAARQYEQACELLAAIAQNTELKTLKRQLDTILEAQFGFADDMSDADWRAAQLAQSQTSESTTTQAPESAQSYMLDYARRHKLQPQIYSELVNPALLEEHLSIEDVLTGWRLFSSRYTADRALVQRLIFPSTDEYLPVLSAQDVRDEGSIPFGLSVLNGRMVKAFPTAYESAALLGNTRARVMLDEQNESAFAGYQEAFEEAGKKLADAATIEAMHNLIVSQGSELHSTTDVSKADDRLHSLLAFQTWQRYLEFLYAKQSYTPIGKSLVVLPTRSEADLEPAAGLYLALAAAASEQNELEVSGDWQKFAGYCQKLARLSQVRAYGVDLNGEQIDFLNSIDQRFGELTGAGDRPIVIDVHSDPNSEQVVQQAVGQPKIVVIDDLRGARMSFHQFKHPMRSRMTDQEWQRSLESQ